MNVQLLHFADRLSAVDSSLSFRLLPLFPIYFLLLTFPTLSLSLYPHFLPLHILLLPRVPLLFSSDLALPLSK